MSDNVLIMLIIVGGLVILGGITVFLLRDRLGSGGFSASKEGVQASVKTHEEVVSSVSGNKIKGNNNSLVAENRAKVDNNEADGDKNDFVGR